MDGSMPLKVCEVVTVAVITYCSANTVCATLNSILNQTYGSENIELIISDDGSKDNTAQIVDQWLKEHKHCFYKVRLFANPVNSGVSMNCNIAWQSSTSVWIKTIAGDDLLSIDCIESYIDFVLVHCSVDVLFSKMAHFINDDPLNIIKVTPHSDVEFFFKLPASKQYRFLLTNSFNIAPTSFIRRSALIDVGYCNPVYKYIEDLPLWLRLTSHGYKFSFIDKITVNYRIADSLSNSRTRLVNIDFINQIYLLHKQEVWPNFRLMEYWRIFDKKIEHLSWVVPYYIFNNKRNILSMSIHYAIAIFRPLSIKKIISRFTRWEWKH